MQVIQIPALEDNYFYLVICEKTREAAFIDPCDAKAALHMSKQTGVEPKKIINTHHHWDHVGANEELKERFAAEVWAPEKDASRIPGFTSPLVEDAKVNIGELQGRVLATPGHTKNHIALYFKDSKTLFCGDTLFSGGCGRLFEGTPDEMVDSLYNKLAKLPDDTRIFCGHEYTENNLNFARSLEPSNHTLREYSREVARLRHQGKSTIPTSLGLEKKINPFLRCGVSQELFKHLEKKGRRVKNNRTDIFTAVRQLKDSF